MTKTGDTERRLIAIFAADVERGEIITDTSFETRIRGVVDQLLTLIADDDRRALNRKPAFAISSNGTAVLA